MPNYTYELPFPENKFAEAVINELKRNDYNEIATLLYNSEIVVNNTSTYSRKLGVGRFDALAVNIEVYANPDNINELKRQDAENKIKTMCNAIIPSDVGFDILSVSIHSDYSREYNGKSDIVENALQTIKRFDIGKMLSPGLIEKGYEMSEAYIYMYAIENTIRSFIEKVFNKKHGADFMGKISVKSDIKDKIAQRKRDISKKSWLGMDSSSDIFLLDLIDLGKIIELNWDLFKDFFPKQSFILPKIDEISDVRNKIVRNSYIDKIERDMLKDYYYLILGQIYKSAQDL